MAGLTNEIPGRAHQQTVAAPNHFSCSLQAGGQVILPPENRPPPKGTPMQGAPSNTSEVAILSRILEPDKPTLAPEAARALLDLDFSQSDKDRMRQLSAKAREGSLTPDEQAALNNYERVGHLLNILQSKARRSLKSGRGTATTGKGKAP